jgi:hypothetical protein
MNEASLKKGFSRLKEPSTFNHQPSTINLHPSTINLKKWYFN